MRAPGGEKRPKPNRKAIVVAQAKLGRIIRQHRMARGLSQSALARLAGIPQPKLPGIENGRTDPRLSTLLKIAWALGLELTLVPIKDAKPER